MGSMDDVRGKLANLKKSDSGNRTTNNSYNSLSRGNNYTTARSNGNSQQRSSGGASQRGYSYNEEKKDFDALDIVAEADEVIKSLLSYNNLLTTSQIRKFLTAVNSVRNKVDLYRMQSDAKTLNSELAMEVKFLKVSILYQAGRDNKVKAFCEKSSLPGMIEWIGNDIKKFEKFCKYVEALIAFHKFNGGKDK